MELSLIYQGIKRINDLFTKDLLRLKVERELEIGREIIVGKERKLRIVTYVDRKSGYLVADLTTAKADDIHLLANNNLTISLVLLSLTITDLNLLYTR